MRRPFVLLLLAALLPLVVARLFVETSSAAAWRSSMESQAADHATAVAALVSHELAADLREAEVIAQSSAFEGGVDKARLTTASARLLKIDRQWRSISISDPAGTRLLDVPAAIGVPNGRVVDFDSQQRAVRTAQPVIGHVLSGPRGIPGVAIRAPVIRDGRVVFVVSVIIDPASLRSLLLANGLPIGWPVRLFDDRGHFVTGRDQGRGDTLTRTQNSGATALGAGFHEERNVRGGSEYAVWRKVDIADWRVEVAVPASDYRAPSFRTAYRITATIVVGLALFVWFVFLLRRASREASKRTASALDAQRLEMLGRMTSGVAHDFNNLLTPIVGGFELLRRRIADDPRAQTLIDAGLQSAERARVLVGHLLAYSRRQTLQPKTIDVGRLILDVRDLLNRTLGPSIELKLELPDHGPWAEVDAVQLELALLNLVINARDAMLDGGTLTIQAAERTSAFSADLAAGRYVRIKIADTGAGMSAATLKMATEPFFTTKPVGAGTGLGLSMVHGLAVQSGGDLEIKSQPGRGTIVEVWLPARDEPSNVEIDADVAPPRATGRILLVDDEDGVRLAHAEMLRDVGYRVTAITAPVEALDMLRLERPFDLLVTDFTMPQISGDELARRARALHPDMPILILTGFAGKMGETPDGTVVLMKPVRQAELLAQVATMLAAKPN